MPVPRLASLRSLLCLSGALLLASSGCFFYIGGDDDDTCPYGGLTDGGAYDPGLRNPENGQCEYFGGGGGGGGGRGPCGACPAATEAEAAIAAAPSWGACESECTGLDEFSCLSAGGCRAIYTGGQDALVFAECWAVDQTGPIQGGGCVGLDATTCSMHDDCSALHQSTCEGQLRASPDAGGADAPIDPCAGVGAFAACLPEREACQGSETCPEGQVCNAADVCLPGGACAPDAECPDVCNGYCVPGDGPDPVACDQIFGESECIDRADCSPVYQGIDCECTPTGCTCADWAFTSCRDPNQT